VRQKLLAVAFRGQPEPALLVYGDTLDIELLGRLAIALDG